LTYMLILAIETSCDETAISIVKASGKKIPKFEVLENSISSQIKIHRPFGGVVPSLAKREHIKNLPIVLKRTLGKNYEMKDIDLIAVTSGPGLEPALWTGINFAEELAEKYKKPLLGVNHLEGHMYSPLIGLNARSIYPAVGLIISGGHTIIVIQKTLTSWEKIGETRDDAIGEAYDKVARLLKLPYPGGPEIEKMALKGNGDAINFPRPMINSKNYDFSFSGLKTAVLYYLRDNPKYNRADVAASFQKAAIETIVKKAIRGAVDYKAKTIYIGGGVAANIALRTLLQNEAKKIKVKFLIPGKGLSTDNGAMIAAAAYINLINGKSRASNKKLEADSNLNL